MLSNFSLCYHFPFVSHLTPSSSHCSFFFSFTNCQWKKKKKRRRRKIMHPKGKMWAMHPKGKMQAGAGRLALQSISALHPAAGA